MMADRGSNRILLAFIAALGIAIGAACDKRVRAQGTPGDEVDETSIGEPEPTESESNTGGGPVEQQPEDAGYEDPLDDEEGLIDEGGEELGEDDEGLLRESEDEGNPDVPDSQEDFGDDQDPSDQPAESGGEEPGPSDDGTSNQRETPGEESEDEAPAEDNWSAPVRGSGGDNPPDFIGTADPTLV